MGGGEIFMSGKGVDERILSMKFDNASFEKNAKVTINTLDKLQRTLDTTKLSKDISNLYSYVTKIGTEVKTFIAIKYAIKGIDAALKSVTEGGKRRAENLENAHFQLQGLLKDEEKVSEIMNDVSKSVDGTAYGLDAAAKVASQLAASNVKAGDQMFTALRGIAGVAAMTNSSYEDIGRIFTQVAGQGRLMGDQLLQLSGRGMNAAATLAEEFGLTEAAVRDMVSKGQISFDMFSQAMDSAFGEHAKKANETMTGALSNVKSALGRIGALFYSPLIEQNGALVQLFNALRVKTNELKDALAPTISKIVDIAIKAINWATSIINKIDFSSIASKILKPFTAVKQTFDDIGTKVQSTSKIMTNASDVINEVINGKWDVGAKRWDKLTNAGYNWVAVQNGVNETLGSTYRHAEQLSNTIDDLTNNVSDSNQVINLSNNTLALTKRNYAAMKTSVSGLSDAMSQLSIYANKAGYSVDDVVKDHSLLSMSSLLLDSLSNIVKIIKSLGKSIAKSWNNVFGSLDNVNPVFNLIAGFRKLTSELQITEEVSDKITRTFNGLFAVLDLIRMVVGGGVSLAMKAIRFIFETFGIKILDVTAALGDAIVAVRNWIKNTLKSSGILNGIKRILTPIIKLIVDAAKSIYNWAKENDLLNKIASGLGTILQGVAYFIEKVVTKVVDWIKNSSVLRSILTKVGSVISELIDKTSKWIDGLKNTDNIPEYIISGLVGGLTNGIVKVKEVVGLLANTILSTLREILGIHSPARVPMEYGELTGEGYAIGLSHANEKGVQAATEFTGKVLTTMKDITVEGARNLVSNMPKIMDVISKIPWGSIVFGGMAIALVKGVGKLNTTIDKVGAIVANNPLTILTKAVENYTAGMKNLLTELGKAKKIKAITQMMYSVAVSIGVLAASIYLLSKVDKGGMVRAMIMITFIAAILAALTSLMYMLDKKSSAWNKVGKDAKIINSTVLNMIGIAASFLLMAAAFKTLASIKQENVAQAIVMMGALWLIALTLMPLSVISNKVNGAGKTMLYIAASFLIMAKVMKYVGKLDSDTIFKGLETLNAFKWMVIQMMAINGLCKSMNNAGKNMMYISVAFLVMAKVVKYAGSISEKETNRGINTLKKFTGLVITLMVVQGVIDFLNSNSAGSKRAYSNVGKMILYIAIAFGVMTLVIKAISKISDKNLKRGIGVLWIFAALVSALIAVGHFLGDVKGSALSIGASILLVTISMLGMAIVAGIIGFIPIRMLKKGVTVVSIFGLIIMGLMKCASYVKPDAKKALGSVLSLMITMAAIVVIFSLIDTKKLYESVGAVAILSALIAGLMIATGYVKPNDDALKGLKKVMIVLVVVAAIIVVMDQFGVNGENALKNAIAIGIILVALAASLFILSKIEKVSKNAIDSLYKITPVLGLIGIVLFLLDAFDVQSNITNAISLGILINALAAAVVILSYSKDVSNDAYKAAIVLGMVMVLLGYALSLINNSDPISSLANALAMSIVLGAITASLLLLSHMKDIKKNVFSTLGMMIVAILAMFAIAGALALMDNMKNTVENAKALSSVLLSLTPIVLVLGIISALLQGDVAMLGSKSVLLILAGMIVTMAAIVGALALMQNIKNAQANAMLLALMLNVMADVLLKIALVAPLALIGAAAMAVLSLVLVELGVLIGVIGGLVTAIPELETFLNKGAPIMVMLAKTLGQMISAFIVGIAEGLMEILPALGKSLSDFANNLLMGFIPVMMIATDESIVKGAGNITAAILAITVAELVQAVATIVTGGAGMINLAIQLSQFAIGIQPFIIACKQVTPEVASGAAAISNAVLTITKAELIAGLLSFMEALTGTNSMTKLTSDLQQFGEAMVVFSDTISGKIDTEAVKAATAAGSMMSTFYENMPREGGLIPGIQKLIGGEPDMEGFSKSMAAFGLALVEVNNALLNENGECVINLNAIKAAADAGKIMVELQNSLPKTGGWVQAVLGETDMGEFGLSVAKYGESIVKFNDTVTDPNTGKSKLNKEAIQAAADAGKIMAELNEKVPTSNGFWQDVAGSKDLGEFGLSIEAYGQAMIRFSDAVVDENGTVKINPRAVDAAYYAGNIFASLTNSLAPQQGVISSLFTSEKDLSDFGAQLESFGTSVVNFSSTVDGNLGDDPKGMVDDVSYIVTSILGVLPSEENGNKAILDKNLIGKFGDNFKTLGEKIKAFSDKVKNIDETAVTSAAQAIKDLSAAGASMESVTTTGANSFGAKLTALADAMYDFNTKIANYDFSGLENFAEALVEFAHISIDNYVLAYKDGYKDLYSAGYSAGEITRRGFSDALLDPIEKPMATIMATVMETIANTLNDDNKKETIRIGAGNVVSLIIAEFNYRLGIGPTATNDFYNIGVKIIASIIDGMSDKAASARDRAGIIRDDIYSAFDKKPRPRAGTKANGNALSGLQSAAEDIVNAMSLSTEFQPTIRPILDLSDITSGGKRINSIFDGFSISTSFRLAATSNSMFNANRSNTISPLDILKNVSGTPKTVNNYEINGISYDDGSTIANAVLQLINAVRVEERM
jgi:tape measure domain-containing protein